MHRFRKILCALVAVAPIFSIVSCIEAAARSKNASSARSAYLHQLVNSKKRQNMGVAYFIELKRAGQLFKTNNSTKFRSGDQIRFHVFANADAYIYIIMRQGSKGTKSVLFPLATTGTNNLLKRGQDCIVPTESALQFDETPGIENVGLILSRKKIGSDLLLNYPKNLTAYVPPASAANHKQGKTK
jgi:hypothetical protein